MNQFTIEQQRHWQAYEKVRVRGQWNMFDTRARRATGLSHDEYIFVLKNYSALRDSININKSKPSH